MKKQKLKKKKKSKVQKRHNTKRHNTGSAVAIKKHVETKFNLYSNIRSSAFHNEPRRTNEGFLLVDTIIAEKGVLPYEYVTPSGETIVQHEFLGDSIFTEEFKNSCNGSPFVLEHPQDDDGNFVNVSPDNYKQFVKGVLIDPRANSDNTKLIGTLKIWDDDVIELIESNRLEEVSQGYVCRVTEKYGTFNGKGYDAEQTNMIMNHLALVNEGRAGETVRVLYNSNRTNSNVINFLKSQNKEKEIMKTKEELIAELVILDANILRCNSSDTKAIKELNEKKTALNTELEKINQSEEEQAKKEAAMIAAKAEKDKENAGKVNISDEIKSAISVLMQALKTFAEGAEAPAPALAPVANVGLDLEEKEPTMNQSDIKKFVLNNVQDTQETFTKAQVVLGADVTECANRFNTLDGLRRHVLSVSKIKSEEEIKHFNSEQVKAYFDVVTSDYKKRINAPRQNSDSVNGFEGDESQDKSMNLSTFVA